MGLITPRRRASDSSSRLTAIGAGSTLMFGSRIDSCLALVPETTFEHKNLRFEFCKRRPELCQFFLRAMVLETCKHGNLVSQPDLRVQCAEQANLSGIVRQAHSPLKLKPDFLEHLDRSFIVRRGYSHNPI